MHDKLPKNVDVVNLARANAMVKGYFDVSELDRVSSQVIANDAKISAEFEFSFCEDNNRAVLLKGKVDSKLLFTCNRCNDTVSYKIRSKIELLLCKDASVIENIPSSLEVIEIEDRQNFNLQELVEEETLLSMPLIAKHPVDVCSAEGEYMTSLSEEEELELNPFESL